MVFLFRFAVLAFSTLFAARAGAVATGMIGASGRTGSICNSCHFGGDSPEVRFEQVEPSGPVVPAALVTLRFVVSSARPDRQIAAGFNVAADAGILGLIPGEGAQLIQTELTHTSPEINDDAGEASWLFTWQAPVAPGSYRLYGAGNSVNLDTFSTGDRAEATILQVEVGQLPTPAATASPTPPPACTGDCDGSDEVTVDEIVTGVSIALGTLPLDHCLGFDRSGDQQVTVDELIEAIQNALSGCRT